VRGNQARDPARTATWQSSRPLRALSTLLIVVGVLVLADVGVTMVWQEPFTALIAIHDQHELAGQLRTLEGQGPTPLELAELRHMPRLHRRIALLARSLRRRVPRGAAAGRLVIPALHENLVLVNGTDGASLRKGPGIYTSTPFPGVAATTAIAGHRTTYLAPFRHLDRLKHGDTIDVRMPYADFHYTVQATQTVGPHARWILRSQGYDRLVLSACAPLFTATNRIVVFARLRSMVPVQAFVESHTFVESHA
jgi:sortase A